VPKIAYPIAMLSSLIDTMFGASESVDIRDVITYIRSNDDVPLPESKEDLDQLLLSLSRYSIIVYLPNLNSQSQIIVNVLRYLEMLLTHARPSASPELEASFLGYLGFHTDYSSDNKKLPLQGNEEAFFEHLPTYEEAANMCTSEGDYSSFIACT